jgi:hypothetical protein
MLAMVGEPDSPVLAQSSAEVQMTKRRHIAQLTEQHVVRAAIAAAVLLASIPARAQDSRPTIPAGFARLQDAVKTGDTVVVTVQDGTKLEGRLTDVTASSMGVQVKGTRHAISGDRVTRVQRKRNGVWLGAVIGAAAGVPFAVFLRQTWDGGTNEGAAIFPIFVGLGAGIAVDALLVRPRTVYERQPGTQTRVSFLIGPTSKAVMLRFSF